MIEGPALVYNQPQSIAAAYDWQLVLSEFNWVQCGRRGTLERIIRMWREILSWVSVFSPDMG